MLLVSSAKVSMHLFGSATVETVLQKFLNMLAYFAATLDTNTFCALFIYDVLDRVPAIMGKAFKNAAWQLQQ